jgi:hypothetical protein
VFFFWARREGEEEEEKTVRKEREMKTVGFPYSYNPSILLPLIHDIVFGVLVT